MAREERARDHHRPRRRGPGAGQVHQGRELRRRDQVPRGGARQHHRVARADRRVLRAAAGRRRRPTKSSSARAEARASSSVRRRRRVPRAGVRARAGVRRARGRASPRASRPRREKLARAGAARCAAELAARIDGATDASCGLPSLQQRLALDDEDVDVLMHAAAAQLDPSLGQAAHASSRARRSIPGSTSGSWCSCSTTASPSGCARARAFSPRRRSCAIA